MMKMCRVCGSTADPDCIYLPSREAFICNMCASLVCKQYGDAKIAEYRHQAKNAHAVKHMWIEVLRSVCESIVDGKDISERAQQLLEKLDS